MTVPRDRSPRTMSGLSRLRGGGQSVVGNRARAARTKARVGADLEPGPAAVAGPWGAGNWARAASTRARLVTDLDPGTATVARTGEAATGAGHGGCICPSVEPSDGQLRPSGAAGELGLELGDLLRLA